MIKTEELSNPNSCLNKAADRELLFVLRGHDVAAAATVRFWIRERIRLGKNDPNDDQILEATQCANDMDWWRAAERPPTTKSGEDDGRYREDCEEEMQRTNEHVAGS
jgi:hypothetical protein